MIKVYSYKNYMIWIFYISLIIICIIEAFKRKMINIDNNNLGFDLVKPVLNPTSHEISLRG